MGSSLRMGYTCLVDATCVGSKGKGSFGNHGLLPIMIEYSMKVHATLASNAQHTIQLKIF